LRVHIHPKDHSITNKLALLLKERFPKERKALRKYTFHIAVSIRYV